MKIVKSIGVALALASLGACSFPKKYDEQVRQVEVGETTVDDYVEPADLHVSITDVESGKSWDVNLGDECRQYPLPKGERFMTRFDLSRYEQPNEDKNTYIEPQTTPIWKYLCG
jgi:hypothetical protein